MTTDESASIHVVIEQERATIAYYTAKLREKAPRAMKVRWRALKRKHAGYIAKWKAELKA